MKERCGKYTRGGFGIYRCLARGGRCDEPTKECPIKQEMGECTGES